MEYFYNARRFCNLQQGDLHAMCLTCKSKQALKKIAEHGHEKEISITSSSPLIGL